jgi:DNA primase
MLRGQKSNGVIAKFSDHTGQYRSSGSVTVPGEKSPGGEQPGAGEESARMNGPEEVGGISQAKDQRRQESRTFGLDKRIKDRIKWEDYLIGLLLQNPGLWSHVCGIINDGDFAGTDTRELYHIFNSVYQRDSSPLFQSIEQFVPSALLETAARARESVGSGSPLDGAGLVKAAVQCATRLKRARLLQSNTELQYLIRGATEAGESATVRQLQQQSLEIHRQLRTIDSAMHLQG